MKSKRKRVDSDRLLQRKAGNGVRKANGNPFETVVMKSKFAVLNRDPQSKQPGAFKKRAIENRKQTLGKEFAVLHKTNRFTDARKFGVNSVRQPSSNAQKKEMYNLNLTHRGQTLAELENLNDVVDDDDDEDEETGRLDDDFTKATHFGGGSDDEGATGGRDRKTVIEEMIAESKRLRTEKQRDNEMLFEKSQELDKDLKLLMSQVGAHMRTEKDRPTPDDYDRVMREMIFERRGTPAEKLKSEELARKEQQRKEKLEQERLERMKLDEGDRGKDKNRKHLSADALDDGYLLNEDDDNGPLEEEEDDDGIQSVANGYDPRKVSLEAAGKSNQNEEDDEAASEDGDDDDDDDNDDNEDESSGSDADSLSDLKNAAPASDDDEEEEDEAKDEEPEPKGDKKDSEKPVDSIPMEPIPLFIEIPSQYEDFATLLGKYTVEQQAVVVERIVQRANENNPRAKAQRPVIFVYIIQHLVDRFTVTSLASITTDFKALHLLTPLLYDLAKKDAAGTSEMFHDILQEKYADFQKHPQRHPPLATLVILKLLPLLFSASDARHSIVTPGLVFISEVLTRCPVRNRRQIATGMLLITTVLECVEQSKRFLPAVLSFLAGVINQACPPTPPHTSNKCVHPFKAEAASLQLVPNEDAVKLPSEGLKLIAEDLLRAEMTESFKIRAVATAVSMISTLGAQLSDCPAVETIVRPFLNQLTALETVKYPAKVKTLLKKVRDKLTQLADRPVSYLVAAQKKPKPLRLLEPKIEPVYDEIGRRPKTELSIKEQRKKLLQRVKKEKRSAAREIRLDNEYIANLHHKRRMESDRERKEKVKRLLGDATIQQGELNSLDRKRKYRK